MHILLSGTCRRYLQITSFMRICTISEIATQQCTVSRVIIASPNPFPTIGYDFKNNH